jgi:hypothetical protein
MPTRATLFWALLISFRTFEPLKASLSKSALLTDLRHGSLVTLMRHASSPRQRPMRRMPIKTTRARSVNWTIQEALPRVPSDRRCDARISQSGYAQQGQPVTLSELGDGGASMQADPTGSHARWLKDLISKTPAAGTNTVIITHFPNISEAFSASAAGLADGEALILQPRSQRDPTLVARIKIGEWDQLDAS